MQESKTVHEIVVDVPIRTAYNQWTQFEEFPRFMNSVKSVTQHGPDSVHFVIKLAGHEVEYEAKILEQLPDKRIVWESVNGKDTGGIVRFEPISPNRTRVFLTLGYQPEGPLEKVGDLVGIVGMETDRALAGFKRFIESRGTETGSWRGAIGPA